MRRILLFMSLLLSTMTICAQESEITLRSNMEYGKALEFSIEMVEGTTVRIDWGDGNIKEHNTRTAWGTMARVSGKSFNETIHIYGKLKSLEAKKGEFTSLQLVGQDGLTRLDASDNQLTREELDLSGAPNLTNLTLNNNDISMLNMMAFEKLEMFSVDNNPRFTTAVFADNNALKNISMDNCDVAHFYPKPMPNLLYLSIDNGDLHELELDENYPKLTKLSLAGHPNLFALDVTTLPLLEDLNISHTGISEINTTRNPKLTGLTAAHTGLRSLSLAYNTNIQTVNITATKITRLDVSKLNKLRNITIDSTDIERLDLTGKIYLNRVSARATKIEFLDMHDAIGYNSLKWLDLRDNKNMTPQTLNYTFQMMPFHSGSSWSTNVWISGIPGAETTNTEILTSDAENFYKVDVKGDGSASMQPVALTVSSSTGGSITLSQIQENTTWNTITTEAKPGYPISIQATPQSGFEFAGVKVNGKLYQDSIFVVSAAATVEPVFRPEVKDQVIKLTVEPGIIQQYFLGGEHLSNTIFIDWGDGEKIPYIINNTITAISNDTGTKGNTVTITGPITHADFSSFPGFGVDNEITSIDISKAPSLRWLSAYFNSIEQISVSHLKDLEYLDVSHTDISTLDISQNKKLTQLRAYSNTLSVLDISNAPELTYLDVKNNELSELNTSKNKKLKTLFAQSNKLSQLDLSAMTELVETDFSENHITSINVSNSPNLKKLGASKNELTAIDLKHNKKLQTLLLENNQLEALDLSNQNMLTLVQVGGNGWDACTLNDFYYSLNNYPDLESSSFATGNTLWVTNTSAVTENDAQHAESSIASGKGWAVNVEGDGTGCNMAYITIMETQNGTVQLTDESGNEIKSGQKVLKNSVITLQATPANGFSVASSKANGKNIENNRFSVTKATDVMVRFTVSNGIETAQTAAVTIMPANGGVVINTDHKTKVSVFTTNGQKVYEGDVDTTQHVQLNAGIYIVKVGNNRKTIVVR